MHFSLFRFAAPQAFFTLTGFWIQPLFILAGLFTLAGLWVGLFVAPTDFQQGEGYRIIFVHVPTSWMSMVIYLAMAFWSLLGLVFNARISGMMTRALAPTGAVFAALSLLTGSLWGKPMWGAWWVWDARLTSELILFFLYVSYLALVASIDDPRKAERAGALIAIVGAINVPIIYFSVKWWNTLHQGASVSLTKAPSMAFVMFGGMILLTAAFWLYSIAITLYRMRTIILEREIHAAWAQKFLLENQKGM